MQNKILKIIITFMVGSITIFLLLLYWSKVSLPKKITIATGFEEGTYYQLGLSIKEKFELNHPNVEVQLIKTNGSYENITKLLEDNNNEKVDFAFYQPGTKEIIENSILKSNQSSQVYNYNEVAFVANLYSQVLHIVVNKDSNIESIKDLDGKRIFIGAGESGDRAISKLLLNYYNINQTTIINLDISYKSAIEQLNENKLDAAFLSLGVYSPLFEYFINHNNFKILDVPFRKALTKKYLFVNEYDIPSGLYNTYPKTIPIKDIQSVCVGAYLLCRRDTPITLVEEITSIIISNSFLIENHLEELLEGGKNYAMKNLEEYPLHSGAINIYEPELRPLLNPDFMESLENLRSFIASLLIMLFILAQWLEKRNRKNKEHKLDRFIHSLRKIEQKQMLVNDQFNTRNVQELKNCLDEITKLKNEVLNNFTIHELNENSGIDCFIEMCFALSHKINSKINRIKHDKNTQDIIMAIENFNKNK